MRKLLHTQRYSESRLLLQTSGTRGSLKPNLFDGHCRRSQHVPRQESTRYITARPRGVQMHRESSVSGHLRLAAWLPGPLSQDPNATQGPQPPLSPGWSYKAGGPSPLKFSIGSILNLPITRIGVRGLWARFRDEAHATSKTPHLRAQKFDGQDIQLSRLPA